jgi:hypothetical protein
MVPAEVVDLFNEKLHAVFQQSLELLLGDKTSFNRI